MGLDCHLARVFAHAGHGNRIDAGNVHLSDALLVGKLVISVFGQCGSFSIFHHEVDGTARIAVYGLHRSLGDVV